MRSSVALLSLLALLCAAATLVSAAVAPTPGSVIVNADGTLTVDNAPFKIKGIAYSPVPVGESVHFPPYGDYFTADYVYIWNRDLPAIASMGLNTLRIYGWNNSVDHSGFLDACTKYNLKVMLTHYVGTATDTPVDTPEQRAAAIAAFVKHVGSLGDHPAILAWSFGNEINGAWNGFKRAIALSYGCTEWISQGCENIRPVDSSSPCYAPQACLYSHLFGWMDAAMFAAKAVSTRPMTSTLADVDYLISGDPATDRIPRFESYLGNMSLLAVQLYRGQTLVPYFTQYASETSKPLLIGEYGVDAMNDPCGWSDNYNSMRPCYNWNSGAPGTAGGSEDTGANFTGCSQSWEACYQPGVVTQTTWDQGLANEILSSSVTVGGILMEWHDEYWKNIGTEDHCDVPCPTDKLAECSDPSNPLYANFVYGQGPTVGGSAGCTYKAHISCSNYNTSHHDLCGYWLASAPDKYVNEAWFGLNGVSDCGYSDVNGAHRLSSLAPRPVVSSLQTLFGGSGSASTKSCAQLQPCWACSQSQGAAGVLAGRCNSQCNMDFQGPSSSSSTAGAATQASSSSTAAVETSSSGANSQSSSGAAAAVESSSGSASSTSTPTVTAVASSSSAAAVAPSSSASVVVSSSSSSSGSAALLLSSSSSAASASAGASTGSGSAAATGSPRGSSTGSSSSSGVAAASGGTGALVGGSTGGIDSGAVATTSLPSSLLALALAVAASLLATQRS